MMTNMDDIRILTVDSSSLSGSVALSRGFEPVAESFLNIQSTHSEKLLKQVDLLLEEAGWSLENIDLFAAVTGPGSFTGLRIGIAMIKGLAQICNKPVAAVSSLQTVAMNVPLASVPVCAFLDARKKEVYTQLFNWQDGFPVPLGEGRVVAPELALKELSQETVLVGSGVQAYAELIRSTLGDKALLAPLPANQLRASQAACLALRDWQEGVVMTAADMVPTYIRPSDAEINLQKKQSG